LTSFKVSLVSVTVMSTVYGDDEVEVSDDEMQEVKGLARSCSSLRCATASAPARIAAAELYLMAYTQRGATPLKMIISNTSAMVVSIKVKPDWSF